MELFNYLWNPREKSQKETVISNVCQLYSKNSLIAIFVIELYTKTETRGKVAYARETDLPLLAIQKKT